MTYSSGPLARDVGPGVRFGVPADRMFSWNPGLMSVGGQSGGGIALLNSTRTVANPGGLSPIGGGSDDTSAIQTAINNASAGQVVLLNAGTFTVGSSGSVILLNKAVTLRGAGAGVTILSKPNGAHPRSSTPQTGTDGTILTPVDPSIGCLFTAKIDNGSGGAGTVLTVSATSFGALFVGDTIGDGNVNVVNATIASFGTYNGSTGTCNLSGGNQLVASEAMHSGHSYDQDPILVVGPARFVQPDGSTSVNLAVDGVQGSYSVTVSSAAGIVAGSFVLIDELSGASWQPTPVGYPGSPLVWKGDRVAWTMHLPQIAGDDCGAADAVFGPCDAKFTAVATNGAMTTSNVTLGAIAIAQTISDASGNILGTIASGSGNSWVISPAISFGSQTIFSMPNPMSYFCRTGRATTEIKEVASVVGNVVTFTSPLSISYRVSHSAQLTRYSDLSGSGGSNSIHIKNAGVESMTFVGGSNDELAFANAAYSWAKNVEVTQWLNNGINLVGTFRCEVRDSYIHTASWPTPGGAGYCMSHSAGASESLIENNIFYDANKVIVFRCSGTGSVVGYNYLDNGWIAANTLWMEVGANASHMAGPHHVLFEGNYSFNFDSDYTHGNACFLTTYRNYFTGARRSFTDGQNQRCLGSQYGSWSFSHVGNILGVSGGMSGWVLTAAAMTCDANGGNCTGQGTSWTNQSVWQLGIDTSNFSAQPDSFELATIQRDGNYDYLTNAQHWYTTPGKFPLIASLYLSGRPAFFKGNTWPWVEPGSGTLYTNPAKQRYDAGTPNNP